MGNEHYNKQFTTIDDAISQINHWCENCLESPTDEQVERAARKLIDYAGGYSVWCNTDGFDLYAALYSDEPTKLN